MKTIYSLKNELIIEVCKLKDKKYRQKNQLFIIEGYHLIEEAKDYLQMVFSTDEKVLSKYQCETFLVNDTIIKKLSSTVNPQNIIGVAKQLNHFDGLNELIIKPQVKLIALEAINDPGNLGTIIRGAAGLGYDGIILLANSVDIYNDKVLRATQGSLFKIPIFITTIDYLIPLLKKNKIKCYGTSLHNATSLSKINKPNSFILVFGNEAHGVSEELLNIMDERIVLPMHNGVESFNVSWAASIIMYEFIRKEE